MDFKTGKILNDDNFASNFPQDRVLGSWFPYNVCIWINVTN